MSYTPPVASAADFAFTGESYVPPLGGVANFDFRQISVGYVDVALGVVSGIVVGHGVNSSAAAECAVTVDVIGLFQVDMAFRQKIPIDIACDTEQTITAFVEQTIAVEVATESIGSVIMDAGYVLYTTYVAQVLVAPDCNVLAAVDLSILATAFHASAFVEIQLGATVDGSMLVPPTGTVVGTFSATIVAAGAIGRAAAVLSGVPLSVNASGAAGRSADAAVLLSIFAAGAAARGVSVDVSLALSPGVAVNSVFIERIEGTLEMAFQVSVSAGAEFRKPVIHAGVDEIFVHTRSLSVWASQ